MPHSKLCSPRPPVALGAAALGAAALGAAALGAAALGTAALLGLVGFAASAEESPPRARLYLIGNSLTWDTVPGRLDGDVQWHVDCGVGLPVIHAKTEPPCVTSSRVWRAALREQAYDLVSVQPHYGATLAQDVEVISEWMRLQPRAVFVIHSGWARHADRAREFAGYAAPDQMTHGPVYLRALVAELRRRFPDREIRQTLAQNLLAHVAEDVAAGRAPFEDVAALYRDDIHLTNDHGKYLMHNAMRRALGQPFSAAGFDKLDPEIKAYLDGVLALLAPSDADRRLLAKILSPAAATDRAALVAALSDAGLRARAGALLPQVEQAVRARAERVPLEADVHAAGGKLVLAPSGPEWLYLATGDAGVEVFDVPAAIDLYNGNNPLKGQGGRNDRVNDAWLERLARATTLRKLDLANCAISGPGLRHLADLRELRELNLTLTPVADDALSHLAALTELRSLGLASTRCTGEGFVHLRSLRKLENVNFHFTPLNDAGLEAISHVPISGRLWFAHTRFTDAGAAALSRLTGLKRCGIGSVDQGGSGEAVAALAKLPLEELALLDNQATPVGVAHAATIATLKKLDLSHAPLVDDASLPALARMPRLEELRLGGARITDQGLLALAGSKSLRKVTLSGLKNVSPAGIAALRAAKPQLIVETP